MASSSPDSAVFLPKVVRLDVYKDGARIEAVNVSAKAAHVLGRNSASADIILAHESVSRAHAQIAQDPDTGTVTITDLRSSQGTFLNGVKIMPEKQRPLKDGDELRFAASTRVYKVKIANRVEREPGAAPKPAAPVPVQDAAPLESDSEEEEEEDKEEAPGADVPLSFGKQAVSGPSVAEAHSLHARQVPGTAIPAGGKRKLVIGALTGPQGGGGGGSDSVLGAAQSVPKAKPGPDSHELSDSEEEDEEEDEAAPATDDQRAEAMRDFARSLGLPVSHEITLGGHSKTVTVLGMDRSGARLITGSNDYHCRLYDFGGMDRSHRAFKSFQPKEDHIVVAISFSPTSDRFLVATGSAQPQVFDRDGNKLAVFVKGDPYILDMYHTSGHCALVTGAQWHPTEHNTVISCGNDGTVRVWDLATKRLTFDQELKNSQVLRVKNSAGLRLPVTAASYSPTAKHIAVGGEDGSVQYWNVRATGNYPPRPDGIVRDGHSAPVTCVVFKPPVKTGAQCTIFASRSLDHTIKLWDISKFKYPLGIVTEVPSIWPTTNLAFSPDGAHLVAGTSVKRAGVGATSGETESEGGDTNGYLRVFATETVTTAGSTSGTDGAVYSLRVLSGDSVVCVGWHPLTKQIVCGCGDGSTHVFYDPTITEKGAMLSAGRAPARRGIGDFVVDLSTAIMNPDVHPERIEGESFRKRMKREEKKLAVATKKPDMPDLSMARRVSGSTFTQHLMQTNIRSNLREQDPRAELLKFAEKAKEGGGRWITSAYAANQPSTEFATTTLEADVEAEAAEKANPAAYVEPVRRK